MGRHGIKGLAPYENGYGADCECRVEVVSVTG